jgi:hypothetical protein
MLGLVDPVLDQTRGGDIFATAWDANADDIDADPRFA